MSLTKTEAFVIKGFRYGDTSKIVTLFTKDCGKFNAIVKGARSFKSRFGGLFENMNYIMIFLNKKDNRDLQIISKAEFINPFSNIKSELEKINTAYRILELVNKSTLDYYVNEKIFHLLKHSFEALNESKRNFSYITLYFQIYLVKLLGIGTLSDENQSKFIDKKYSKNETFNSDFAFKINEKQYSVLLEINSTEINELSDLNFDNDVIENLQSNFDYYLSMNLQNFGYLKTKKIINDIQKDT